MAPDVLTVTTDDRPGGVRVLVAAGEIDRDSRRRLREAADEAVAADHHRLVLDLTAVTFCDSSGLSLLVDLHRDTQAHGGWLRLACLSPTMRTMLSVTNLDRLLDVHDTVDAATAQP